MNRSPRRPYRILLVGIALAAVLVSVSTSSYRKARASLEFRRAQIQSSVAAGGPLSASDLAGLFPFEVSVDLQWLMPLHVDVYSSNPTVYRRLYALKPVPAGYRQNQPLVDAWFDRKGKLVRISYYVRPQDNW